MKVRELIRPNDLDLRSRRSVVPLPGIYDKKNLNIGAKRGVEVATVVVRSTATGQVYGRRSIYQKS